MNRPAAGVRVVVGLQSPVCAFTIQDRQLARLRECFPQVEVVSAATNEELAAALPHAAVYWGWSLPGRLLAAAPALRWVATPAAGLDWIGSPELAASGIPLTNSHFHGRIIAESVAGMLLHFTRQLGTCARLQTAVPWCREAIAPHLTTLQGKTAAIIGFGPLGGHVARLLAAFGMRLVGINRSRRNDSGVAVAMHTMNELPEVLAASDHVILTLPGTEETRGLFSDREFALMKPGACLVNVGRGSCIDEAALCRALTAGRLLGAGLDVFTEEPLSMASPLRALPNVLITPHSSAMAPEYMDLALEEFMGNLRRFLAGEPLENSVAGAAAASGKESP